MTVHTPLRESLRRLDPERAERQSRLIGALNHRELGELRTVARVAVERDRRAASAWIRFRTSDSPVSVAPLLIDGELAHLTLDGELPDAAAAAATLARIEPVVAGLERVLGDALHPQSVETAPPEGSILLRVDAGRVGGPIEHRLIVAIAGPADIAGLALPARLPAAVRGLRANWHASIAGPAIAVSRIATLQAGDVMLLGVRPLLAHTSLPGHKRGLVAAIDVSRGLMTLQEQAPEAGAPAPDTTSAATDWDAVRVSTTIEIDGGSLTAAEAAALGGGSTLRLPGNGGTLTVRVRAGDTLIGSGELVAIGDGFGVLFTSLAAQDVTASGSMGGAG